MAKLIGLAGRAGAGKSYLATILCQHGYIRHSFAAPLKSGLVAMGMPRELLDDKVTPHPFFQGRTSRYAMQTLGTEWGRKLIGPDFWVNAWDRTRPEGVPTVVDDVRFSNEVEKIRVEGGTVIWVSRPDQRLSEDAHESELLDKSACDITYTNSLNSDATRFLRFVEALP